MSSLGLAKPALARCGQAWTSVVTRGQAQPGAAWLLRLVKRGLALPNLAKPGLAGFGEAGPG